MSGSKNVPTPPPPPLSNKNEQIKLTSQHNKNQNINNNNNNSIPASSKVKTEETVSNNSKKEDEPSNIITEKLRNVYVMAPLQTDPETFVIIGEDNEIMLLKKHPLQEIFSNDFHALINIKYNKQKDTTKTKIIKTGTIMKGKSFPINMSELNDRVQKKNIKIVGKGKFASPINDEDLKEANEHDIIEHLQAKVIWISTKVFDNGELNIKVMTEHGLKLLITLENGYHDAVHTNGVFRFVNLNKTNNWSSKSPVLQDMVLKLRTRSNTTIEEIEEPSAAFKELGKEVGTVVWIDQQLQIFNQCKSCFKGRFDGECRTDGCMDYGLQLPENPRFRLQLSVDDKDDNNRTIRAWNDQLVDFPSKFIPTSNLGIAVGLQELEQHFLNKEITYRHVNIREGFQIVGDVCLKLPTPMDSD